MRKINSTIEYYEKNASDVSFLYEKANMEELHKKLLYNFSDKDFILEIGCGSGRDAAFLSKSNKIVVAIDKSKSMINEAKSLHPEIKHRFFTHDFSVLNIGIKFDGIYSIATLMHLSKVEILDAINNIANALCDDGIFIFSVSLYRNDTNEFGLDKDGRFFQDYSEDEWINICIDAGLKIVEVTKTGDGLNRKKMQWMTVVCQKK